MTRVDRLRLGRQGERGAGATWISGDRKRPRPGASLDVPLEPPELLELLELLDPLPELPLLLVEPELAPLLLLLLLDPPPLDPVPLDPAPLDDPLEPLEALEPLEPLPELPPLLVAPELTPLLLLPLDPAPLDPVPLDPAPLWMTRSKYPRRRKTLRRHRRHPDYCPSSTPATTLPRPGPRRCSRGSPRCRYIRSQARRKERTKATLVLHASSLSLRSASFDATGEWSGVPRRSGSYT